MKWPSWKAVPWPLWLLAGGVVLWLLWVLPMWFVYWTTGSHLTPKELEDVRTAARTFVVQAAGGAGLLYGLVLNARRIQELRRQNELTEQGQARQNELTEQRQTTERFTRAVELLSGIGLSARLGGIYALERIARDSPEDWGPVMEVLTAHVRDKRRRLEGEAEAVSVQMEFQAVLDVLGRSARPAGCRVGFDVHGTDLHGAVLEGAGWAGSDQRRGPFTDLSEAVLHGAWLAGADLSCAWLADADLSCAWLADANLIGTCLAGANLSGANLRGAKLKSGQLTAEQLASCSVLPDGTRPGAAAGATVEPAVPTEARAAAEPGSEQGRLTGEEGDQAAGGISEQGAP